MKPTIPDPKTVKSENVFFCVTCESKKKMTIAQTKAHLKKHHNVEQYNGTCHSLGHLDCKDFFHTTRLWEVKSPTGIVKLTQSIVKMRSKKDPMRF